MNPDDMNYLSDFAERLGTDRCLLRRASAPCGPPVDGVPGFALERFRQNDKTLIDAPSRLRLGRSLGEIG